MVEFERTKEIVLRHLTAIRNDTAVEALAGEGCVLAAATAPRLPALIVGGNDVRVHAPLGPLGSAR